MKKVLSLILVLAMIIMPMNVIAFDGAVEPKGAVTTLDSQVIEDVAAGAQGDYYYLPEAYGTYTVTVTGATGFQVGIYDVPMSPMPTVHTDVEGVVEMTITTNMMLSSISLMVLNNGTEVQDYTVTVTAEVEGPEALDTQVIEGVAAGAQGEYYYLPESYGTYIVTVTGETGFQVGIYDVPMSPMPTVHTDVDGTVEMEITTSMMVSGISLMILNNSTDVQDYTVTVIGESVEDSGDGDEDVLEGSGTQDDPYTLKVGTTDAPETNKGTFANFWGTYFEYTATEAGTLTFTIDETNTTCAEAAINVFPLATEEWVWDVTTLEVNAGATYLIEFGSNSFSASGDIVANVSFVAGTISDDGSGDDGSGDDGTGDDVTPDVGTSFENPAIIIMDMNTAQVTNENPQYYYNWVATESGTLWITMKTEESGGAWGYDGMLNGEWFDSTVFGFFSTDENPVLLRTIEVVAGDELDFMVFKPDYSAGTIVFSAFFAPGEVESDDKEEYVVDFETKLELGANTVTLDPNANNTIFEFEPAEEGTYKFETSEGFLLGYWGAGTSYVWDQTENKTNVLEYTLENVGPSIMIGVAGEGECIITVSKVAGTEGTTPEPEVEWVQYENKFTPVDFSVVLGEGDELVFVDVTDGEDEHAVLGADGYYHLNTADGPILLVNIGYNAPFSSLMTALGYGQVRVVVTDEDGNVVEKIDYTDALIAYNACAWDDNENDQIYNSYYPMTEDLMEIYKVLGEDKGWYDVEDPLGYYLFVDMEGNEYEVDAEPWLFACAYVDAEKVVADIAGVTGEDSEWTQGSDKDVVITLDADIETFKGLYIDGKEVAPENYTVKAGSIIITLKAAYLDTLALGEHTVVVVYNNATVTNLDLTVVKASTPEVEDTEDKKDTEDTENDEDDKKEEIDKKGDVSNVTGYMVVLMGVALVVVALVAKKKLA